MLESYKHDALVIGHWSLVIGHWSLVIGHWSLGLGLVIGHSIFIAKPFLQAPSLVPPLRVPGDTQA